MSLSSISLPRPKNWQDFENSIWVLFTRELDDPNTQKNGRSGQKQCGVDVCGYRNRNCLVGIQCKKKFEKEITEEELRSEVNKAKKFKPKIAEFILVTTAPRDQKIQEVARQISAELSKTDHPIFVSVWGWDDVEEHASKHAEAWKAFDPTWNPFAEKVALELQELRQSINLHEKGTIPPSCASESKNLNESNENTPLHGQITALQQLVNDGYVHSSLKQLMKLKDDKWSDASRSERYRILVGVASAKLKLGEQEEAGKILLVAYNECPEHKNAPQNRATGYLLKKDYNEAARLARIILVEDDSNAYVAGILIQARIIDNTCTDPLCNISKSLYETEEVLIAYIHFLRCRENNDWIKVARMAAEKHSNSRTLKLFFAEAMLDNLIRNDRDVIAGGISKNIKVDEFHEAVEVLYSEACDALNKECIILPSTAHNAALAIRFSGDIIRAKEILDASIKQHQDDESLRFQRAIIAYSEDDPNGVIAVLSNKSLNPESICLVANALIDIGKINDALSLIENIDDNKLPEHVKTEILSIRVRIYLSRGEKQLAADTVDQCIVIEPESLALRSIQIRTYRALGDHNNALEAFEKALELVNDQTDLPTRLSLSHEARRFGCDDIIIDLLKGRVATYRENEGLHLLIAASINSGFWVTARETLDSTSPTIQVQTWFQKAKAILALNIGDVSAEGLIVRYLKQCPNDLDMILARVGIWQRVGKDIDIRNFLQHLNLIDIDGRPEQSIRLAALICHYEDASRGLEYGYSILMNNWDNPQVHLAYQGLIFLNKGIEKAIHSNNAIAENTVVCLLIEDGERRFRIEKQKYRFFEDERLSLESDLGILLIGKRQGEKFKLQEHISSRPVEVKWIKSIYLDAFHRSLEEFNVRFPRANGLLKFSFDPGAPDPMENIRVTIKACIETDRRTLEEYRLKGLPLSFVAGLIGKDSLDVWNGLPGVNVEFQVCRGILPERQEALQIIRKHGKKGCVLDAITLSIVHRLGVEKAVSAVCGPIFIPQSVIDLLVFRSMVAR